MKKSIVVIVLGYSCILNASFLDAIKEKANVVYDHTKEVTSVAYDTLKENTESSLKETKDFYKSSYINHKLEKKKEKEAKLNECIVNFEERLPQYGLFLEQNYMNVNKRNESKILQSYKKLNGNGISQKSQFDMNRETIKRLYTSISTLEYMNIVLSELKIIENKLKQNNPEELDMLVKNIQFLMYAWTTPMEILSTKKIYNSSLLGISHKLYQNIKKNNYKNYTQFIYSMLFINLINFNPKLDIQDSSIPYIMIGNKNKENNDTQKICKSILSKYFGKSIDEYMSQIVASTLSIDEDVVNSDINKISKNNLLFEDAVFFDKSIDNLAKIDIINYPLNDNWYIMTREYMELQDDFYKMKKELDKIIKILTILPNTARVVAILKQDLFNVDALYRKFDESVRYNFIDLPISIYSDLYYNKFIKNKGLFKTDKKDLEDIAIAYNKSCANMQKYMVSEFAINKVMRVTRLIKEEFNENEWKEVKTRAKLTQDWFNMLNKVEIKNK
ncbi:hypothetical protein MNB_SV-9-282 [hydrothermal vent metagenome]|uniref:Uncharacterized protein n=1 Tax=hydrothermal vent metagenome TaxID=652676 RepID=A0A1W1CEX1_9ZZZZ